MPVTRRRELEQLRQLDPARDHVGDPTATDRALLAVADPPGTAPDVEVTVPSTRPARRSSGRRRVLVAGAVLAVAATVAAIVAVDISSGKAPDRGDSAADATVARLAPLVQGATVDCAGVRVPVSALAAAPGAENAPGPDGDALRAFLADNPFEGMGSVTNTGWTLLDATPDRLVFGQRVGELGVGPAVVLTKRGDGFAATQLGGCGDVVLPSGEPAATIETVVVDGATLDLSWYAFPATCGGVPDTTSRFELTQTADAVHVVILRPVRPDQPTPSGSPGEFFACAASFDGVLQTTRIQLDAPLGDRDLLDDGRVPPTAPPVQGPAACSTAALAQL